MPKYVGSMIKPHQIGGVRFMWDNLVEDLEEFKRSDGFGCILAHSMGLGKTLQVFLTWQRKREIEHFNCFRVSWALRCRPIS